MSKQVALNFSHFGIFVSDLVLMKQFYTDVLGFFVTDDGSFQNGQRLVFLSRDPEEHHQVILVSGRPEDPGFNPINQVSFFVQDLEELQAFFFAIEAARVDDLQPVTHGNAWSIYFRDPEGNRLEVYTHTPWYVSQPLRVPVDLGRDLQELRDETEAMCRDLPGFQSRAEWLQDMQRLMNRE